MPTKTQVWRIKNKGGKWFNYSGVGGPLHIMHLDSRVYWVREKRRAHKFIDKADVLAVAGFLHGKGLIGLELLEDWE